MVRVQPMKMAAAEALWETADPAPMSLFTWGHEPERRDLFAVKVPGLLSFLAYNRFAGEVKGIKNLQAEYEVRYGPGDYVPPVMWTYWNFRAMVGAGMLMLLLAAWAAWSRCCASASSGAGFCWRCWSPRSRCPISATSPAGSSPRSAAHPGSCSA